MSEFLSLYVTAPSRDVAKTIGRTLVEKRLAAYVDIIRDASIYRGRQGRGGERGRPDRQELRRPAGRPNAVAILCNLEFFPGAVAKKGRKTAALSPV
jgi:hypothetical protein